MAKEKPLSDRRSLFSQSNTSNYSNSVFSDFIRYSQTLTNRFVNPIKSGGSGGGTSSPIPTPSPTPAPISAPTPPTPSPTPAPVASITPGTYSVGDSALGGKIAYILQPGDPGYDANSEHGFVVNSASLLFVDQYAVSFGCSGYPYYELSGNSSAIGAGSSNTDQIMAECANKNAAYTATNLVEGGRSDWYLPSKNELNKLYLNKTVLGIDDANYLWSSTVDGIDNAWAQSINTGTQVSVPRGDASTSGNAILVRAIRSF
jgi:hypothetical protein